MSEKTERAKVTFDSGFNCAQAVLGAFAPELGLSEKDALRVAGAFGGGMGRLGRTCGAVVGAFMAVGLVSAKTAPGEDEKREAGYALVHEFRSRFEARHGATECRPLLGVDLSTEAGLKEAVATGLFSARCTRYVNDAVEILEEILP